eukprot:TRINITY_DN92207_c0_g1_i1.p1 TRINITY_DN92207_c0_g1~~TRINITY_DN92207_c0_g1_i1.p1  ORF type:complete len:200 (+),score=35.85 TRINITY_DN92207_c0_g1_i1:77-676(+)
MADTGYAANLVSTSTPKSSGKGKVAKGKPVPPPIAAGKGSTVGTVKGGGPPKKTWVSPGPLTTLKDDNAETLARFRAADCYSCSEVQDALCIDWEKMEDVAVVKGSLETDDTSGGTTGIVLAKVAGRLVAFRNICDGRGANPVREYFASAFNQVVNDQSSCDTSTVRLPGCRIVQLLGSATNTIRSAEACEDAYMRRPG